MPLSRMPKHALCGRTSHPSLGTRWRDETLQPRLSLPLPPPTSPRRSCSHQSARRRGTALLQTGRRDVRERCIGALSAARRLAGDRRRKLSEGPHYRLPHRNYTMDRRGDGLSDRHRQSLLPGETRRKERRGRFRGNARAATVDIVPAAARSPSVRGVRSGSCGVPPGHPHGYFGKRCMKGLASSNARAYAGRAIRRSR